MAENATHTLHNLLTLRGAVVRDAHGWSRYLTEAIARYGSNTDVVFASHHWPMWGRERIVEFLSLQRDLYAYLNDQTLRLINRGYTAAEAAESFELPPALEKAWHARGYYGSVSHNVKATVQKYIGWFDGNPARLWPHPPARSPSATSTLAGGIDDLVAAAQDAFDDGDFRWAATLLDHAVFADEHERDSARALRGHARATRVRVGERHLAQLLLLRRDRVAGQGNFGTPTTTQAPTVLAQLPPEMMLDAIAIRVDGPTAWDLDLKFAIELTDLGRRFRVTLRNGALVYLEDGAGDVDLTIRATKSRVLALLGGDSGSPDSNSTATPPCCRVLVGVLDPGDEAFNIVTP